LPLSRGATLLSHSVHSWRPPDFRHRLLACDHGQVGDGRVLGVDACGSGWIGIALSTGEPRAYVDAEIGAVLTAAEADGPLDVIAIDIPIGLADAGPRRADLEARQAAGPRRTSVFITPVRSAIEAGDYAQALAVNRRLAGAGISKQAYALRDKILQVDRLVRHDPPATAVEVHPELSFAEMAGAPLRHAKSTWAGAATRLRLLADAGIHLPDNLGVAAEKVGVDDVLDAAAAAWTAMRVQAGAARSLPQPPERFSDGIACAIWI